VVNLSPAVSEELGLEDVNSGVAVIDPGNSIGRRLGFRKGDVIVDVNGQPINSVQILSEVLAAGADYWSLAINRKGRVLRLQVAG
jgi:S1-C subfamily serine protease